MAEEAEMTDNLNKKACGAIFGQEYEHDDPNWQPPKDWPYEVKDLRTPAG